MGKPFLNAPRNAPETRAQRVGRAPDRPLGLAHWPFCASPIQGRTDWATIKRNVHQYAAPAPGPARALCVTQ